MKFIPETSRDFVDDGKIKTYTSSVAFPELSGMLSFQKKIVLPKGRAPLVYKNCVERVFIFLSGTAQIIDVGGKKRLMKSETFMVVSQGIPTCFLTSGDSSDLEYIELVFSADRNYSEHLLNLLFYTRSDKVSIMTSLKKDAADSSSWQCYRISLQKFNAEKEFNYKKSNTENSLLVYVVSGEVKMNGLILNYNDSVLFTSEDGSVLGLFMKKTELLILEIASIKSNNNLNNLTI